MKKGIILTLSCENVGCPYSDENLQLEETLNVTTSTGNCSFKVPKVCPKCKSSIKLRNFYSGNVEIKPDVIKENE